MLPVQILLNLQYMAAAQSQPLQHVWLLHGNGTHSLPMSSCEAVSRGLLSGIRAMPSASPDHSGKTAELELLTQISVTVQERFDHHCAVCPSNLSPNLHTACIGLIGLLSSVREASISLTCSLVT